MDMKLVIGLVGVRQLNEMIERVSKAIHDSDEWPWASTKIFDELEDHQKEIFYKFAMAAIKAMREPTEEMCMVDAPDMPAGGSIEEVWKAMIDEILK